MSTPRLSPVAAPVATIRPLTQDEDGAFGALVAELHPQLSPADFAARLAEMRAQGYQAVGLFRDGTLVAVSGFWVLTRFYVGRTFVVDNLVVADGWRKAGLGQQLLDWLEAEARALGCVAIVLDTYTQSTDAQRFYIRNRFDIIGFHFSKRLTSDAA